MVNVVNFDRFFFAFSIGSHVLLVTLTIALAFFISVVEFLGIRKRDQDYEILARRMSKALIIIFAIGTASGTMIAIELFALFPKFMDVVGQVAILPFYAEVFAFFLESIALVMYFYFWDRFKNRYTHWVLSLFVTIGTTLSAIFITMINSWMNTPNGFNLAAFKTSGVLSNINPFAVFNTTSTWSEEFHVVTTTFAAGSFAILAYFLLKILKSDGKFIPMLKKGAVVAASTAAASIILAGLSGTLTASMLITVQPLKYAAIELNLFKTSTSAPEMIGGILINGIPKFYITIPHLQNLLAFPLTLGKGTVPGLYEFNPSTWPPLFIHLTFDVMVLGGTLIGLFMFFLILFLILRKNPLERKFFIYGGVIAGILAELVYDSGWVTDEVGRQPWIIYNEMTVTQAANTSPSIIPLGIGIMIFYIVVIPFSIYYIARVMRFDEVPESPKGVDKSVVH